MQIIGGDRVSRVRIRFQIANNDDLVRAKDGTLPKNKVRRMIIGGLADPGATKLVLPQSVVTQLGLPEAGPIVVTYADRRSGERAQADAAYVKIMGRDGVFRAIVEPKRKLALVGAIVLEELDLLVDCAREKLVPRDPRRLMAEVE
jgi:predicted aspartyl protease